MPSTRPQGNKFTQEYEVYSQRFQREDFGDDDPFDPKLLPNEYLDRAEAEPHVRLCLHDSAHGAEPFRRGRMLRADRAATRGRGRRRHARHSDSRLRPHHRGRMSPRLHRAGDEHLARHAPAFRCDPHRPHRHARRAHRRALWRAGLPLRRRAGDSRWLPRGLRAGRHHVAREDERRVPQGRRTGRQSGHADRRRGARPNGRRARVRRHGRRARHHRAGLQSEDHPGNRQVRLRAREGDRPLSEDPHLRRQRSAAHARTPINSCASAATSSSRATTS